MHWVKEELAQGQKSVEHWHSAGEARKIEQEVILEIFTETRKNRYETTHWSIRSPDRNLKVGVWEHFLSSHVNKEHMKESVEIDRRIYDEDFFENVYSGILIVSYTGLLGRASKIFWRTWYANLVLGVQRTITWHPAHALRIILDLHPHPLLAVGQRSPPSKKKIITWRRGQLHWPVVAA